MRHEGVNLLSVCSFLAGGFLLIFLGNQLGAVYWFVVAILRLNWKDD